MQVLPRVVFAAVALAVIGGTAGCSRFDSALGQRQAIVSFRTSATIGQRLAVRTACGKLPSVTVTTVPDLKKYPYALQVLTFGVSGASDAQIANLEKCLDKFPAVQGVTLQDSSDDS